LSDEVDLIRQRVSIVDLVSEKVALKRSGKNWTGLCPFHDDKNPSFTVSEATGRYKCWSCGATGDIFNWTMEIQRLDFRGALEALAEKAGIELKKGSKDEVSKRKTLFNLNETALQYFRESLAKNKGALDYCSRRGLDEQIRDTWEIGFAPLNDAGLTNTLKKAGFQLADGAELFLLRGDPSRGYEDLFKDRLMFSIRDDTGKLVAFGGRLLGQGQPKYINSSDTPLFSKSRVLYGMHRAKEHIAEKETAVLVEGYLDVIACHRAGVRNAVASLGTAFHEEHVKQLKRWCKKVIILYDSDEAGQKASSKASSLLQEAGVQVRVALLPVGQDPDSLLKEVGPEAVVRAVESGVTKIDFEVAQLQKRLTPESEEFWDQLVEILCGSRTELELETHVERLGPLHPAIKDPIEARNSLRSMVIRRMREKKKAARKGEPEQEPAKVARPVATNRALPGAERTILLGLLSQELRHVSWSLTIDPGVLASPNGALIADAVRAAFPTDPPFGEPKAWLVRLDPVVQDLLTDLEMKQYNQDVVVERKAQEASASGRPVLSQEAVEDAGKLLVRARDRRELQAKKGTMPPDEWNAEFRRLWQ